MSLSLYDISVPGFKQMMGSLDGLLNKGAEYCQATGFDLEEMLQTRFHDDMRPFQAQIIYGVMFPKMTLGALKSGEFSRAERNNLPELDYPSLKALVADFANELDQITPESINALADNSVMINKLPDVDKPFRAADFVLSFTHPNTYFHVATAYDILRMIGVPLAKPDMLGPFRSNM